MGWCRWRMHGSLVPLPPWGGPQRSSCCLPLHCWASATCAHPHVYAVSGMHKASWWARQGTIFPTFSRPEAIAFAFASNYDLPAPSSIALQSQALQKNAVCLFAFLRPLFPKYPSKCAATGLTVTTRAVGELTWGSWQSRQSGPPLSLQSQKIQSGCRPKADFFVSQLWNRFIIA